MVCSPNYTLEERPPRRLRLVLPWGGIGLKSSHCDGVSIYTYILCVAGQGLVTGSELDVFFGRWLPQMRPVAPSTSSPPLWGLSTGGCPGGPGRPRQAKGNSPKVESPAMAACHKSNALVTSGIDDPCFSTFLPPCRHIDCYDFLLFSFLFLSLFALLRSSCLFFFS